MTYARPRHLRIRIGVTRMFIAARPTHSFANLRDRGIVSFQSDAPMTNPANGTTIETAYRNAALLLEEAICCFTGVISIL